MPPRSRAAALCYANTCCAVFYSASYEICLSSHLFFVSFPLHGLARIVASAQSTPRQLNRRPTSAITTQLPAVIGRLENSKWPSQRGLSTLQCWYSSSPGCPFVLVAAGLTNHLSSLQQVALQPNQATQILNDRVKRINKINFEIADWLQVWILPSPAHTVNSSPIDCSLPTRGGRRLPTSPRPLFANRMHIHQLADDLNIGTSKS